MLVNLTDDQFREARRHIVATLQGRASNCCMAAQAAIESEITNSHNPLTDRPEQMREEARGLMIAANVVRNMEREGYVWGIDQ